MLVSIAGGKTQAPASQHCRLSDYLISSGSAAGMDLLQTQDLGAHRKASRASMLSMRYSPAGSEGGHGSDGRGVSEEQQEEATSWRVSQSTTKVRLSAESGCQPLGFLEASH